jgi:hypothetical protein
MKQVEESPVDLVHVARAEIAQEVVHRRQRIGQVAPAAEVLDIEMLARVRMREAQRPRRERRRIRRTRFTKSCRQQRRPTQEQRNAKRCRGEKLPASQ